MFFSRASRFWTTEGTLAMASSATWPIRSSSLMPYLLDEFFGLPLGDPQLDELAQVFRLGLLHSQPGVDRVELDQGLAWLDPVADIMIDLDDPAAAFRAECHLLPAPQRADDLDGPLDRPVLEGRDRHRHDLRCGRSVGRGLRPFMAAAGCGGHEQGSAQHRPRDSHFDTRHDYDSRPLAFSLPPKPLSKSFT